MDDLGFILGSYIVTFGSIALYVASVVKRSRRAGRVVLMDDLGFILGSYIVTFGSIALYVASVVKRSRRAGRVVSQEQRPWT